MDYDKLNEVNLFILPKVLQVQQRDLPLGTDVKQSSHN